MATAAIRLAQVIPPPVQDRLDRIDIFCTLLPLRCAARRARFQVRAWAFDREHRGTRLLAWAAALDALAYTLRTIPSAIPPGADAGRIEDLTNTAALLRAIAETERIRYAARRDPTARVARTAATPEIEAAAGAQLDLLCHQSLNLDGRISLLNQLAIRLHPALGQAVQVLRDLM